jgi:biopolymer transport protein ExbD
MAEITHPSQQPGAQSGKKRAKKHSTRVDLTAVVDMAFLLLTFFILATTFNKAKAMQLIKPIEDEAHPAQVKKSKTLTILCGKDDRVFCYVGDEDEISIPVDSTSFSINGLRTIIQKRQLAVAKKWGSAQELFVLIKPLADSKYRNMVDVLDEMAINDVKKYAIMEEFSAIDDLIIQKTGNRKPDPVKTANAVVSISQQNKNL